MSLPVVKCSIAHGSVMVWIRQRYPCSEAISSAPVFPRWRSSRLGSLGATTVERATGPSAGWRGRRRVPGLEPACVARFSRRSVGGVLNFCDCRAYPLCPRVVRKDFASSLEFSPRVNRRILPERNRYITPVQRAVSVGLWRRRAANWSGHQHMVEHDGADDAAGGPGHGPGPVGDHQPASDRRIGGLGHSGV